MKKFILLLILVIFAIGCTSNSYNTTTNSSQGRVVFTMADAAANMGAVSSVQVTVDKVEVHSTTQGWVTLSSEQKTYDLLQLKAQNTQALLADVNLTAGTYEQVRLDISKVVVTDANGTHEAKLPSGELKIVGDLVVNANSTSTAKFDFIADESLHMTGNGEYILAPVVQLETKEDAEVNVGSDNKVEVKGGRIHTSIKVGMNENGEVGAGLELGNDKELSIEGGKVKVGLGIGREETKESSNASTNENSASANTSTNVHVSTSSGGSSY